MKVMKFGGTSVGSPERIREVAQLLIRTGEPLFVVLSAMSGTTNALVEISRCYHKQDFSQAHHLIEQLQALYQQHINQLYQTDTYREKTLRLVQERFDFIRSFSSDFFTSYEEKQILAQGEIISTNMMVNHLQENGYDAILVNALDIVFTDKNSEPDQDKIRTSLSHYLSVNQGHQLYITQGFICTNAFGETDNLQRGGSDYTASLIGAALPAQEIQIWTDIDGIHTGDPRIVDNTRPIRKISFEEAAELAYFGAKILHPTCVQPAKQANIPLRLKYTMNPEAEGTLIGGPVNHGHITAVAAKDGLCAAQLRPEGYLSNVRLMKKAAEIFDAYQVPVNLMSISEGNIQVCFEGQEHIASLQEALKSASVQATFQSDLSIICVVGDLNPSNHALILHTTQLLRDVPALMVSYGPSPYSISFVVPSSRKRDALTLLNNALF